MLEGQFVLRMTAGAYYTPPFPAAGARAIFQAVIESFVGGSSILHIDVESRFVDETSWTVVASSPNITADGTYAITATPLRQLVRFKLSFTGGGGATTDGAYVQFMTPSWLDY